MGEDPGDLNAWRRERERLDGLLAARIRAAERSEMSDVIKDQPPPVPNAARPVWEMVIEDMRGRDRVGRERYGVPLQPHNGRDALVDLYQELLDACVYTRQVIEERGGLPAKHDDLFSPKLTTADAAYLAGLIDGEGCIQARANGAGEWVRPTIEVCMTNPAPLQWAVQATGVGSFYECKPDPRGKRRQAFKWIISSPSDGARLLRALEPYMKVKRGEALAYIALASVRQTTPPGGKRSHPQAEARLVQIIATLKAQGGTASSEAYQEALDLCVYLRQAIAERDAPRPGQGGPHEG